MKRDSITLYLRQRNSPKCGLVAKADATAGNVMTFVFMNALIIILIFYLHERRKHTVLLELIGNGLHL